LRELSFYLNIKEFYLHFIHIFNLYKSYDKIFGLESQKLIAIFLEIIDEFMKYQNSYYEFLEYLSQIDLSAKIKEDNSHGVNLLTMHGAKGLQAKIVILALENSRPKSDFFHFDSDRIIFNKTPSEDLKDYFTNLKNIQKGEELRLLYVALTRAKNHLAIFSLNQKSTSNIYNLIRDNSLKIPHITQINDNLLLDSQKANLNSRHSDELKENNQKDIIKILDLPNLDKFHNKELTNLEYFNNNINIFYGNIYHELIYILAKYHDFSLVINILKITISIITSLI
jgi:ATP-dependent exoDNAse (exonuclease V) beta subunit (contains helicase and exonuclease domains)